MRLNYGGSNRVVLDSTGTRKQQPHYYPSGLPISNLSTIEYQPYMFQGKEFNMMHGLRWHDHGARFADNTILRWTTMDPLCEKYYDISPYVFCLNNPLRYEDPDGNSVWKRGIKFVFGIGKAVAKDGLKALGKAATYTSTFTDIKENVETIFSSDASIGERIGASISIASEFLPISDVKDVDRLTKGMTSRSARREAMRQKKIPTSRQPDSQIKNESGYEYRYNMDDSYGNTKEMSVQDQTKDRSHPEKHWESGEVKKDKNGNVIYNNYGRPKLDSNKSKVEYE